MKQRFLGKPSIGIFLTALFCQNIFILPILSMSIFIVNAVINKESIHNALKLAFAILSIACNIFNLIRCNIITVTDDKIIMPNFIGKSTAIEVNSITSLKVFTRREFRKYILNSSAAATPISNCYAFLLHVNNALYFENKYGFPIAISVWKYNELFDILKAHETEKAERQLKKGSISKSFQFKMPLSCHIKAYFKNWQLTLAEPIAYGIFFGVCFFFLKANPLWGAPFAIFLSVMSYHNKISKIFVNDKDKYIRFYQNNASFDLRCIIKYTTIKNLRYADSANEITDAIKNGRDVISTPYDPFNFSRAIAFDLDNGITVFIIVKNDEKLYEILKSNCDNAI